MHFDIATALFITSLLTFTVGASLRFAASRYPVELRDTMRVWIGGLFLQAAALFAPSLVGTSPDPAWIIPLNFIYALAYAEMGRAVDLFAGRPKSYLSLVLVAIVVVNSVVLGLLWRNEVWRVIMNSIPLAALQYSVAHAILHERRPLRPADYLTGTLFIACAGLALARGFVVFLGPRFVSQETYAALSNVVYIFSSSLPMIGTIGFVLMCGDRLNDDLARLAMVDPLTGVYNRRTLAGLAATAITNAQRHAKPLSLLALDVDHFKRINDEFGHDVGDDALCGLVALIQEALHQDQILCRIGGEEFAVLVPGLGETEACLAAERVRQHIAASPLTIAGVPMNLRVSIGVATLANDQQDLTSLLREADRALYSAKRNGRDRIAAASRSTFTQGCLSASPALD
ncbi:MAG: GGDEF domain-containing protein [Dokdonella sp.]